MHPLPTVGCVISCSELLEKVTDAHAKPGWIDLRAARFCPGNVHIPAPLRSLHIDVHRPVFIDPKIDAACSADPTLSCSRPAAPARSRTQITIVVPASPGPKSTRTSLTVIAEYKQADPGITVPLFDTLPDQRLHRFRQAKPGVRFRRPLG
jgi:hypothetical protein